MVYGDGTSGEFTDSRRRAFLWEGSGSPTELEEELRESAVLEDLRQQILDLTAGGVLSASQGDALVGAVDRIIYDL